MKVSKTTSWMLRLAAPMTLATAVIAAQGTPPPPRTPAAQQPVFRTTTNLIQRDVRVRDSKGQFVYNLTGDQFEVYEDGVLQKLTYFQPFFGGRPVGASTAVAKPKPIEGVILPQTRQTQDMSGRIFIIFIDDLHFLHRDTINARQVLMQIRDNLVKDTDLIGIVSSGYSSIETDLVYDYGHKRLNEAIEKTMGSGMSVKDIVTAAQTSQGPAGLRFMAHTALRTVNDLLERAQQFTNRRKAFIYLSSGYDFDPFKDARLKHEQELYGLPTGVGSDATNRENRTGSGESSMDSSGFRNPFAKPGNEFAEADLVSDLAEVIRSANRANVALYTMDPRGLVAGPDISDNVGMTEFRDYINTSINSLMALSNNTGGFCACNTNDFKRALERIDNETSDYYMLGYQSSNPDPLKFVRRVEIKIKKEGLKLEYSPQYTLKRPEKTKPPAP